MKNKYVWLLGAGLLLGSAAVQAQTTDDKTTGQEIKGGIKKGGRAVGKSAKKTGNKTAEVASKGKSKVVNTQVKDKEGPNGENIYISKDNRYYWIDKKGRNIYIAESELRSRVSQ